MTEFAHIYEKYFRDVELYLRAICRDAALAARVVDKLTDLVPVVLGFLITISGILKLQNSVDLLRLGHGTWHVAFALAIINIVFGVVLLINPFAKEILITLVGIGFVYSGATDLYVTISISRKLAHVEEEYGEELQNIK